MSGSRKAAGAPRRDPLTDAQLQEAVNLAEVMMLVDSARKYGLISGGPKDINLDRCEEILLKGRIKGIRPRDHEVDRLIKSLAAGIPI